MRTESTDAPNRRDHPVRAVIRSPYLRLALLAATAVTVAWTLASQLPLVSALVAAITALIALRPTFHDSLKETVRQVVGTLIGAAAAALLVMTVGMSPIALFAAVVTSFVAARLMRLGDGGATTIAITVLLVVSVNVDGSQVEARFLGVVLGSALGLAASWFDRPGTPTTRALNDSVRYADRLVDLLTEVSSALSGVAEGRSVDPDDVTGWRDEAEQIGRGLALTRADAEDAVRAARWTPKAHRTEAEQVLAQVRLHEATTATVVAMCRDLRTALRDEEQLPLPVAHPLSQVFAAAAEAITRQSGTARDHPAAPLPADVTAVQALAGASQDARHRLREVDRTAPLLLGGSLLADGEEISRLLTGG
jgi:uncharacterized membrane protein YccC